MPKLPLFCLHTTRLIATATFGIWLLAASSASAQRGVLELYIDPDCHNCQYVVEALVHQNVPFEQYSVNDPQAEQTMWEHLERIGVDSHVVMPVVLIDEVVVFPVYEQGKLQRVSHRQFVPQLLAYLKSGQHLPYPYLGQDVQAIYQPSTFEYRPGAYYLIAYTSTNPADARAQLENLQHKHPQAVLAYQDPFYKVVQGAYTSYSQALASARQANKPWWVETTLAPAADTSSVATTGLYHVIVASYSMRATADIGLQQWRAQGFDRAQLLCSDDKWRISVAQFAEAEAAEAILSETKRRIPRAWIIKL